MSNFRIPDLDNMSDDQIQEWVQSLTTEVVFANLVSIATSLRQRFGDSVSLSTATYQPPRLIQLTPTEH